MHVDEATGDQTGSVKGHIQVTQDEPIGVSEAPSAEVKKRGRKKAVDAVQNDEVSLPQTPQDQEIKCKSPCLPDPREHNESMKSWSESISSSYDKSHNPLASTEILSAELRQFMTFIVDRAGKSAVSIINTCAMDDHPYWRMMFECGMADAISEDQQMETEFLERMVSKPGLPHAWKLVDYYLTRMPEERKQKLFCETALRKRDHPASACFYEASFMNSCGGHIMNVLKVMIEHGMPIQPLIDRNFNELERATLLGHKPFIAQLAKAGAHFPDELIRSVYVRAAKCNRDVDIIAMLITEGQMPLSRFLTPKLLAQASKEAKTFLDTVSLRLGRIPESETDPEEEDAAEAL